MSRNIVKVPLGRDGGYEIVIEAGALAAEDSYADVPSGSTCVVVTDDIVGPLYAEKVARRVARNGKSPAVVRLPSGEAAKTWSGVRRILDAMVGHGCDRHSVVYALGGGVVGDLAGFAASCFMRGVAVVQMPTTLLAQVDSSVGGKTGFNLKAGKNLVGSFHQPVRVVIDLDVLKTLPPRELAAGMSEVVKYGLACDGGFLQWIESQAEALRCSEPTAIGEAIRRSCEIKADIVGRDEREGGARAVLNFGHTFAHAIEAGEGYGRWLHGEAVAAGMVLAADLSERLHPGLQGAKIRTRELVRGFALPDQAPRLGVDRYLQLMRSDKKSLAGGLRFVLLEEIGRAVVREVAPSDVAATLLAST